MLSVKQDGITYHFLVFDMTPPGIILQSRGPLTNTLHATRKDNKEKQLSKYVGFNSNTRCNYVTKIV